MSVLFIQYPPCSTCQKAGKWLREHGISYEERHIVEQNPTVEELREWQQRSGLPLRRFFNTSGMMYREMQLKDRLPQMTEEEQLEVLASNGMLVKRPLVVAPEWVLVGFREGQWEEKML
jgi:arsenate reductase